MEIKEKIYQMFILGADGEELKKSSNLANALEASLGGVILFTKNIKTLSQTQKLINDIKSMAKTPLFISIDQEGGRVERTENLFDGKKFLSAKFQAQGGQNLVLEQTQAICDLLKTLGFNMNFAPVLDVNTNPKNPIIGERAYGDKTKDVEKFGLLAMQTYIENEIIPVVKHFPGHGEVEKDSHLELPTCPLTLKEMEETHISPFEKAIKAGAPAVMVAHLYCPCFDKKIIPASLSQNVIKNYLIQKLKFDGVVISDDMVMGGVKGFEPLEAIKLGVEAGINLFIFRESNDETIKLIEDFVKIAQNDTNLIALIEKSFNKIQKLKSELH